MAMKFQLSLQDDRGQVSIEPHAYSLRCERHFNLYRKYTLQS